MLLFSPTKSIGAICNRLPTKKFHLGVQSFIGASTGNQIIIYDTEKLRIKFVGLKMDSTITAFAFGQENYADIIYFSTANSKIYATKRYDILWEFSTNEINVKHIECFGDVIILFDFDKWFILNSRTGSIVSKNNIRSIDKIVGTMNSLCALHLPGKINTYIFASYDCMIHSIDVMQNQLRKSYQGIVKFLIKISVTLNETHNSKKFGSISVENWQINCIECLNLGTNAIFVGVSHKNARSLSIYPSYVILLHLEDDEVVYHIELSPEQIMPTSMTFKNISSNQDFVDNLIDPALRRLLYVGCWNGDIVVIDVEEPTVLQTSKFAHFCDKQVFKELLNGVTKIEMLSAGGKSGCLFYTSGIENSIKIWHFLDIGTPIKVLKQRSGFYGSITNIEFYKTDQEANDMIVTCNYINKFSTAESTKSGSLGMVSMLTDVQNSIFSFKKGCKTFSFNKATLSYLPPIIYYCCRSENNYDWPNIISCHDGMHHVIIWSGSNKCFTGLSLELPRNKRSQTDDSTVFGMIAALNKSEKFEDSLRPNAISCCISHCGHFAFVGYENGSIGMFNLQSRRFLGFFNYEEAELDNKTNELISQAQNLLQELDPIKTLKKKQIVQKKLQDLHEQKKLKKSSGKFGQNAAINALEVTGINTLISFCYQNSILHLWDIKKQTLIKTIEVYDIIKSAPESARLDYILSEKLCINYFKIFSSCLILGFYSEISLNSCILLIDRHSLSITRIYDKIQGKINVVELSPSNNFILISTLVNNSKSSSNKKIQVSHLKIFDIISDYLINWVEFANPLRTMKFHESAAYLITAHDVNKSDLNALDSLIISGKLIVWANLLLFKSDLSLNAYKNDKPIKLDVNNISSIDFCDEKRKNVDDFIEDLSKLPDLRISYGAEFSRIWNSTKLKKLMNWQSLNIITDSIIEEKEMKNLPFFLTDEHPNIVSNSGTQDTTPLKKNQNSDFTEDLSMYQSNWYLMLNNMEYDAFINHLISSTIIEIQVIICSLLDTKSILNFMRAMIYLINTNLNINFVQTILYQFTKIHFYSIFQMCNHENIEIEDYAVLKDLINSQSSILKDKLNFFNQNIQVSILKIKKMLLIN